MRIRIAVSANAPAPFAKQAGPEDVVSEPAVLVNGCKHCRSHRWDQRSRRPVVHLPARL